MPVNKTQEQLQAIYPDFEIGFDSPPAAKRIEPPRKRAKILHNQDESSLALKAICDQILDPNIKFDLNSLAALGGSPHIISLSTSSNTRKTSNLLLKSSSSATSTPLNASSSHLDYLSIGFARVLEAVRAGDRIKKRKAAIRARNAEDDLLIEEAITKVERRSEAYKPYARSIISLHDDLKNLKRVKKVDSQFGPGSLLWNDEIQAKWTRHRRDAAIFGGKRWAPLQRAILDLLLVRKASLERS